MSDQPTPATEDTTDTGLSDEEGRELEERGYVRLDKDLVWREPGGRLRREPLARLYYVQTPRGVFRVSRLTQEIIEV